MSAMKKHFLYCSLNGFPGDVEHLEVVTTSPKERAHIRHMVTIGIEITILLTKRAICVIGIHSVHFVSGPVR